MRELAITMYLFVYKIIFAIYKLFPLKEKVVFLVSFPDNPLFVYAELKRQGIPVDTIFLSNNRDFQVDDPIYSFNSLRGIFHLATAKQVIADNYYGFLAVTNFKSAVKVTQIWHAAGAIKRFGAVDAANKTRSTRALHRFTKVYHRFDYFAIWSDYMGEIFKQAYLATDEKLLKTGVPRTDFFFQQLPQKSIADKKIVLYAPTFRRNQTPNDCLQLDVEKIKKALGDDYLFITRLHPSVDTDPEFADYTINELLAMTDILITDYSSLPMEFALLDRPMIFYAYDLADYEQEHGFWEPYQPSVSGPTVTTIDDLIAAILNPAPLPLDDYLAKWATYNDGRASEKLVNALFK